LDKLSEITKLNKKADWITFSYKYSIVIFLFGKFFIYKLRINKEILKKNLCDNNRMHLIFSSIKNWYLVKT